MKRLQLFFVFLIAFASAHGQVIREVSTTKYGELAELLGDEASQIEDLTINGPINDDDLFLLFEMSCKHVLTNLDLKKTQVEGDKFKHHTFNRYINHPYEISKLKKIILPETLTDLGEESFFGASYLEEVVLPETITEIPTRCFHGCGKLERINFPSTLQKICTTAFYRCFPTDTSIILPEGLTTIEDNVFTGGCKIEFLSMPSTLESIGENAIPKVKKLWCRATTPPELVVYVPYNVKDGNMFLSTSGILYVPKNTVDKYRNAVGFSKFQDIVETDDFPDNIEAMQQYTGVEEISYDRYEKDDNGYYDLMGRRLEYPSKGHIYIHNGQKIRF